MKLTSLKSAIVSTVILFTAQAYAGVEVCLINKAGVPAGLRLANGPVMTASYPCVKAESTANIVVNTAKHHNNHCWVNIGNSDSLTCKNVTYWGSKIVNGATININTPYKHSLGSYGIKVYGSRGSSFLRELRMVYVELDNQSPSAETKIN